VQEIDSVPCGDDYTAAAAISGVYSSNGGYFTVSGADVWMQMEWGQYGSLHWTREVHVPVGNGILQPGTTGVQFRNYIAGVPATVSAGISEHAEPSFIVQASGSSSVTLTGITAYNVRSFGAKGDGVTDDTNAIQRALAAAAATPGSAVYFPAGVYLTSGNTIESGTTLLGFGATIKRLAGATGPLLTAAAAVTGVTVTGLHFDNNGTQDYSIYLPNGSSDIDIGNNVFVNDGLFAVWIASGASLNPRIYIHDNEFLSVNPLSNQDAVGVVNPAGLWVYRNNFDGSGALTIAQANGIDSYDVFVYENRFNNFDSSAILIRTNQGGNLHNVHCVGNIGTTIGTSLLKGLIDIGENVLGPPGNTKGVVVVGNQLRYYGGVGINIGNNAIVEDVTIIGNTIDASDLTGTVSQSAVGIGLRGAVGFTCDGNTVRGTGLSGIRCYNGGTGLETGRGTITGNYVDTCGQAQTGSGDEGGIGLFDSSFDIVIADNTCRNNGGGNAGAKIRQAGIQSTVGVGITDIVVTGNRCYDDRVTPFQEFGVRIGDNGADGVQPLRWLVENNHVFGNATQGVKFYNTTPHGHLIGQNLGDLQTVPSNELAYVEFTASVLISAATEATANVIVSAGAVTFDGGPVIVEFFSPYLEPGATALSQINVFAFEDGATLGQLWLTDKDDSAVLDAGSTGCLARRRLTPTAGAHTIDIRACKLGANGHVLGGLGGAGNYLPGYMRITKVG